MRVPMSTTATNVAVVAYLFMKNPLTWSKEDEEQTYSTAAKFQQQVDVVLVVEEAVKGNDVVVS